MTDEEIERAAEGMLFAMGNSIAPSRMADAIGVTEEDIERVVGALAKRLSEEHRGIRIIRVNGSFQMCSSPDIYEYLIRLEKQPKKYALTDVTLETLSIIAYRQPVTKAEIEKIRGVSSDHAVSKLVEYGLVQELGRLDAPGRPMLFGTTDDFLRAFGLASVEDLPAMNPVQLEEFRLEAEKEAETSVVDDAED